MSDSSKLAVYYTCQRQRRELRYYQRYTCQKLRWELRYCQSRKRFSYQESKVVQWYFHCQEWHPHTIYSWLDMVCPIKFGSPDNGPDGWDLSLPWFAAELASMKKRYCCKRSRATD